MRDELPPAEVLGELRMVGVEHGHVDVAMIAEIRPSQASTASRRTAPTAPGTKT